MDEAKVQSRNVRHAQSQEAERPDLKTISNNSQQINAQFQETKISGGGSQESGIEVIETAYSRTNAKKRIMQRPPTAGGPQDGQS